jgi:hypothetical protein
MLEVSLDTTEKLLSAIAALIAIVGGIGWLARRLWLRGTSPSQTQPQAPVSAPMTATDIQPPATPAKATQSLGGSNSVDVADLKRHIHLLFIDDDRGFKIVGILKKMGWENTKLVTDISSLEQPALLSADVVFVDIQGVGRLMQHTDEGLGLALAIKRRHPGKKVVIYSAEEKGARFHEAHQEADYNLPKTADPIRFEDTIVRVLTK